MRIPIIDDVKRRMQQLSTSVEKCFSGVGYGGDQEMYGNHPGTYPV